MQVKSHAGSVLSAAIVLFWPAARAWAGGWDKPYTGEDVTGPNVVAIWQFRPGQETADGKGDAHIALRGKARFVKDERFGGALESFCSGRDYDKGQGAATKANLDLTPDGAFTLEAWIKLKKNPANPGWRTGYIIDKMYIPGTTKLAGYNRDYYLRLGRGKSGASYRLEAGIGLGEEVIGFVSDWKAIPLETWTHAAFCYNAKGTGTFFLNGEMIGRKTYPGKRGAVPGRRNVSIGDRSGSTYSGLPGYLAQVRVSRGVPRGLVGPVRVKIRHRFERTAFERMESGQTLLVTVENSTGRDVTDARLEVDNGFVSTSLDLGTLNDDPREASIPLSCTGRAGAYTLTATVTGKTPGGSVSGKGTFAWNLCARLPRYMPVVMWGGASFEQMEDVGFTHRLEWMDHLDMNALKTGEPIAFGPRMEKTRTALNEALVRGLRILGKISPGGYLKHLDAYAEERKRFLAQDAYGNPAEHVDFALPRVQQWAFDVGRSVANNVGMFPAVDLVLPDSEFRDSGQISFRPETRTAFKAFYGFDIPKLVRGKSGVRSREIPGFPRDRIVPDDDPILTFYRWYWGGGDGYPGFVSNERRGVKGDRKDLRVFWDPAVRCPSKWGSGGDADLLGHWTYVYPDPLVMGLAVDEILAMAKGGPPYQKVTKMTQIICYRSGTTGALPEDRSKWAEWEKRLPDTKFITVPPDLLEIGFWQKIARPVQAIMYHGAGSLWPSKPGGYDYTHPDTAPRLAGLVTEVVRPLGPMLLDLENRPADVAMLESFTSQMFYGGATYGTMRTPVGRMHAVLSRAHIQVDIVYDETILRDGLGKYKVLVAPLCYALTESVAERIREWQDAGGILVGDELLAPRLMPDVMITTCTKSEKPYLTEKARELRAELAQVYTPYIEADTPEAIVHSRRFGSTDYLFAVNDRRTYGDYIGQYRRVMEKGEPLEATLTVRRARGTVYDLETATEVPANRVGGALRIDAAFGPGDGHLYMIAERPVASVALDLPASADRDARTAIVCTVLDTAGRPADAVIPLRIDITDAAGQPAEGTGWHAAKAGVLKLTLDIAPNDAPGNWTLRARELASGQTAEASFIVR